MLEIARQSVPDGYGNTYFWVKPPRIVPADLVRTVGGRLDHTGAEVRPFDEDDAARGRALLPGRRASTPSASASCTRTRTTPTSGAMREVLARSTPTRSCRISLARCCASTASTSAR